jgi:uncharacterized phage protein (TIGR02218 family)
MTIYSDREISTSEGQPVEAYRFVGTFREYRYTSADIAITVGGLVYDPLPVKRNNVRAGTQSEDGADVEIEIPADTALVRDYTFNVSPPSLTLTIYRVHQGTDFAADFAVYWTGPVSGINVNKNIARVKVPSVFTNALQGNCPSVYYQTPCNHVLFDTGCKLSRGSYRVLTAVDGVSDVTVQVVSTGAFASGFFIGGEVFSSRGERRMITNHILTVMTINYPFADLRVGDSIEVTAGCDHSLTTCNSKYSNVINYGGFPYIPNINPFEHGV